TEPECRGRRGSSCPIPVAALAGEADAVTRVSRNVYSARALIQAIRSRALDSKPRARLPSRLIHVDNDGAASGVNTNKSRNRLTKTFSSTANADRKTYF